MTGAELALIEEGFKLAVSLVPKQAFSVAPVLTYVDNRFTELLNQFDYPKYGAHMVIGGIYTFGGSFGKPNPDYNRELAAQAVLKAMVAYYQLKTGVYPYNPAGFTFGGFGYNYLDVEKTMMNLPSSEIAQQALVSLNGGDLNNPLANSSSTSNGSGTTDEAKTGTGFNWKWLLLLLPFV